MSDTQAVNTEQAQPQAQLAIEIMPIEASQADLAVVLRVLDRAGISPTEAARALNIHKGHMSRILSGNGDTPVPFVLVRYLFERTGDLELLDLISGGSGEYRLARLRRNQVPAGVDIDTALPSAMAQLAEAAQMSRGGASPRCAELLASVLHLLNGAYETAVNRAPALNARTNKPYDQKPIPGRPLATA